MNSANALTGTTVITTQAASPVWISYFFVTRAKKNTRFRRIYSPKVDRADGLICDRTIMLVTPKSLAGYPEKLRCVKYFAAERKKRLVFLTNNFVLPALTIAKLYKCRWQIELFFNSE